jgi:hypothetical protein
MTPVPAFGVDRVDRIEPRVQERSNRKREPRPLPAPGKDEREPDEPAPAPRADDDDEQPTIDLLVRGRELPTGQILPGPRGESASSQSLWVTRARASGLH